jgi:serine/threonine protein kinase/Tfp pilus assembly protein PilF
MSDRNFENTQPEILGERYELQKQLSAKGGRKTLLALDRQTQELVVIKLLSFGNDFSWDDLKLFEREADTLKSLNHPSIPRYLDYFEVDSPQAKGFALVQNYIDAPSLQEQLQSGRTFSSEEVKQFAKAILSILDYLHSRQPPVIHRDLKPSNILLTNRSGNNVGDVYLVDFGSVQSLATKNTSTMTIVGTFGYMPPEQFGGKAKPASDLYSLGATLIYLVTGQHPADLPETDQVIEFEQFTNISQGLINWLKKMTQPSLSRRFVSVKDAIQALEISSDENKHSAKKVKEIKKETKNKKPNDSKVTLTKNSQFLEIVIPPVGFNSSVTYTNLFFLIIFTLLVPLLPTFFISTTHNAMALEDLRIDYVVALLKFLGYPFSIAVGGGVVYFLFRILFGVFGKMRFRIDRKQISLIYELFGIQRHSPLPSSRNNISRIKQIQKDYKTNPYLVIWAGKKKYELSSNPHFSVTTPETSWLAEEISNWLDLPVAEHQNIHASSDNSKFYFKRAESFYKQDDYQAALKDYDRAIQLNPKIDSIYFLRGLARSYFGNIQGALEDFSKQVELTPNANNFYNLGVTQYFLEMNAEAIASFSKVLELDSKFISAYYNRSNSYYESEQKEEALKDFDRALQLENQIENALQEEDEHGYYARGLAKHRMSDDTAGAIADLEKAAEIALRHKFTDFARRVSNRLKEIQSR